MSRLSKSKSGTAILICLPIGPKNTKSVDDISFLLSVKFRWILSRVSVDKSKIENINDERTMDEQTYDGQRAITIVYLSLRCINKNMFVNEREIAN